MFHFVVFFYEVLCIRIGFNADPDSDTDPDPGQTSMSQKFAFLH
jgi:hypothetical protein